MKKSTRFAGPILVLGLALSGLSARVAASPRGVGGAAGAEEGGSRPREKHPRAGSSKKKAVSCSSDAACGTGEHCSTRDGVCLPPPGCKPGEMCAEVCYGTCVSDVRKAQDGKAAQDGKSGKDGSRLCAADGDCHLTATYCEACRCVAQGKGEVPASCAGAAVRCVADPCAGQKAVCRSGSCVLAP